MVTDAATVDEDEQSVDERPLEEDVWDTLVDNVIEGTCTPFLGAGVAVPHLPTGRSLATTLAQEYGYPLEDPTNLPRVAQYIATVRDPLYAKRRVRDQITTQQDQFLRSGERFPKNYQMLANLGLPLYLTTNYDDFLTRALKDAYRAPQVETCRWNVQLFDELKSYPEAELTVAKPFVFHLHGQLSKPNSLLVTEDDYIDFTVSLGERDENSIIPHWIRRALATTALLFVGYSLEDWNFRVLMRQLMKQQKVQRHQQALSLSVQLSDKGIPKARRPKAERFLADYLGTSAIQIYWGPAGPFLEKLDQRISKARAARDRGSHD